MQVANPQEDKEEILDELYEILEVYEEDKKFELDFINNILYINLEEDQKYILNMQKEKNHLKLYSPISGEQYFYYNNTKWISERVGEIKNFLLDELKL